MGELMIRRNRGFSAPTRQESVKAAKKSSAASQSQKVSRGTGLTVSETMRRQMSSGSQAVNQGRESRRALQSGEAVLAEVQDSLKRMAALAEKAAGGGEVDRDALQAELELLQKSIDRMVNSAMDSGTQMFADEEQPLPDWLTIGITQKIFTAEELLAELGLEQGASGAELLAAIGASGGRAASGYLASLYLGAVIAGGDTGELDPEQALDGLRQLMEKVAEGVPIDDAIKELTGGKFTSVEDFQNQFFQGTAPGMEEFLTSLLPSADSALMMPQLSLLDFLPSLEGVDFDLVMELLNAGQSTETAGEASPDGQSADPAAAAAQTNAANGVGTDTAVPEASGQFGNVVISGKDLSGVSYDASTGVVTIAGAADVVVKSAASAPQAIQITGSGMVTLADVNASAVTVSSPQAHIASSGESVIAQLNLPEGAGLTLSGGGLLRVSAVHGNPTNLLRLESGAVVVVGKNGETFGRLTVPVILAAPASLAAQAVDVRSAGGKPMEPMDVVWKVLFPGFSSVSLLEAEGHQAKMSLLNSRHAGLVRLWMEKGDLSAHGNPFHSLMIQGKDELGRMKTRYAYLYWNQHIKRFEKADRYPNPFTVTGGEAGLDWVYEESTQTLHILSEQVTAISGGAGAASDEDRPPFSGRIDLADGIGAMALTLGGVTCRVSSGRAFYLGGGNQVTLLLTGGIHNFFESGEGFSGISLGEGTSLRVDCGAFDAKTPSGTLTATGGDGGAGIGRDAGSREHTGPILLRGSFGLRAKDLGDMQSITIAGGTVTANGNKKRTGRERRWMQRSVSMQMGEYTAILPQFRLSSKVLQLSKLRVSTREYAKAAMMTIDADRHWISQIQSAYSALYRQLDGPVRDTASAGALLEDVRQAIPRQRTQGMRTEDARRLLR